MYKSITNYVLELGVKPTTKGFRYLIEGIELAIKSDGVKLNMFKDIYSKIAKKYNDTWLNVERTMRYAVQNCEDINKKYLSVGEFLARIKLEKKFKGENKNESKN